MALIDDILAQEFGQQLPETQEPPTQGASLIDDILSQEFPAQEQPAPQGISLIDDILRQEFPEQPPTAEPVKFDISLEERPELQPVEIPQPVSEFAIAEPEALAVSPEFAEVGREISIKANIKARRKQEQLQKEEEKRQRLGEPSFVNLVTAEGLKTFRRSAAGQLIKPFLKPFGLRQRAIEALEMVGEEPPKPLGEVFEATLDIATAESKLKQFAGSLAGIATGQVVDFVAFGAALKSLGLLPKAKPITKAAITAAAVGFAEEPREASETFMEEIKKRGVNATALGLTTGGVGLFFRQLFRAGKQVGKLFEPEDIVNISRKAEIAGKRKELIAPIEKPINEINKKIKDPATTDLEKAVLGERREFLDQKLKIANQQLREIELGERGEIFSNFEKLSTDSPNSKATSTIESFNNSQTVIVQPIKEGLKDIESTLLKFEKRGLPGEELLGLFKKHLNAVRVFNGFNTDIYTKLTLPIRDFAGKLKQNRIKLQLLLQGKTVSATKELKQSAIETRAFLNGLFDLSQKSGLVSRWVDKKGNYIVGDKLGFQPDYLPTKLRWNKIVKQRKQIEKHLVKTGQVKNLDEAENMINLMLEQESSFIGGEFTSGSSLARTRDFAKKAGNVEFAKQMKIKLPDEFYITNIDELIPDYINQLGRRLAQKSVLGDEGKLVFRNVENILEKFKGDKEARDYAIQSTRMILALDRPKRSAIISGLMNINLGLNFSPFTSTINLSQNIFPLSKAGFANTARALTKTIINRKTTIEEAKRAGAVMENMNSFTQGLLDGEKSSAFANFWLSGVGFKMTERYNRELATQIGKNFADDLFNRMTGKNSFFFKLSKMSFSPKREQKKWIKVFKDYGVDDIGDAIKKGKLTEDQKLIFGGGFSNRFHFTTSPLELPLWAQQSEMARFWLQFKSFGIKQMNVLRQEILKDPRGIGILNPAFARFIPSGIAAGEVARKLYGRDAPDNLPGRILEDFLYVGTLGLYGFAITQAVKDTEEGIPEGLKFPRTAKAIGDIAKPVTVSNIENLLERGFSTIGVARFGKRIQDLIEEGK